MAVDLKYKISFIQNGTTTYVVHLDILILCYTLPVFLLHDPNVFDSMCMMHGLILIEKYFNACQIHMAIFLCFT